MVESNIGGKISKSLGGMEDLAIGKGTIDQIRGGKPVTIHKISLCIFADLIKDFTLSSIDTDKIDKVHFTGKNTVNDGLGGTYMYMPGDVATSPSDTVLVDSSTNKRWFKVLDIKIVATSDSTASDINTLRADFNSLLQKLRDTGIM